MCQSELGMGALSVEPLVGTNQYFHMKTIVNGAESSGIYMKFVTLITDIRNLLTVQKTLIMTLYAISIIIRVV